MEGVKHSLASRLFKDTPEAAGVRRFVTCLRRSEVKTTGVPMDQVLNQEIVERVLTS